MPISAQVDVVQHSLHHGQTWSTQVQSWGQAQSGAPEAVKGAVQGVDELPGARMQPPALRHHVRVHRLQPPMHSKNL